MTLWLVPVDEPSYQATLAEPIDLSEWDDRPDTFPSTARVWGVRTDPQQGSWERNRRNLDRMEPGDPLLIYRNSQSQYTAAGRVGPMTHTEYIRDNYWNGGPALDAFVIEQYDETINLDPATVNRLLDYDQSFWPQGLWGVSDDRPMNRVVQKVNI